MAGDEGQQLVGRTHALRPLPAGQRRAGGAQQGLDAPRVGRSALRRDGGDGVPRALGVGVERERALVIVRLRTRVGLRRALDGVLPRLPRVARGSRGVGPGRRRGRARPRSLDRRARPLERRLRLAPDVGGVRVEVRGLAAPLHALGERVAVERVARLLRRRLRGRPFRGGVARRLRLLGLPPRARRARPAPARPRDARGPGPPAGRALPPLDARAPPLRAGRAPRLPGGPAPRPRGARAPRRPGGWPARRAPARARPRRGRGRAARRRSARAPPRRRRHPPRRAWRRRPPGPGAGPRAPREVAEVLDLRRALPLQGEEPGHAHALVDQRHRLVVERAAHRLGEPALQHADLVQARAHPGADLVALLDEPPADALELDAHVAQLREPLAGILLQGPRDDVAEVGGDRRIHLDERRRSSERSRSRISIGCSPTNAAGRRAARRTRRPPRRCPSGGPPGRAPARATCSGACP